MNNNFFTYRDDVEGKVGIGKLPEHLHHTLDKIATEYSNEILDKNASTYHTWFNDMSPNIYNSKFVNKTIKIYPLYYNEIF